MFHLRAKKCFELTLSKISFYVLLNLLQKSQFQFNSSQFFLLLTFDLATAQKEGAIIL